MRTVRVSCSVSVIALLVILSGCATVPPESDRERSADDRIALWQAHSDRVRTLKTVSLNGRMAVKAKPRGVSANLRFVDTGDTYQLRLNGPFGAGTVELRSHPVGVELITSEGEREVAASAEVLVQRYLNVALPVSGVRYWVRGILDPTLEVESLQLDNDGRAIEFGQANWQVTVTDYTELDEVYLPSRVILRRDDVTVKIAIHRWRTG